MTVGTSRILTILGSAVLFGILMEVRRQVSGFSMRALVAACAGSVLGLAIVFAQTRK